MPKVSRTNYRHAAKFKANSPTETQSSHSDFQTSSEVPPINESEKCFQHLVIEEHGQPYFDIQVKNKQAPLKYFQIII